MPLCHIHRLFHSRLEIDRFRSFPLTPDICNFVSLSEASPAVTPLPSASSLITVILLRRPFASFAPRPLLLRALRDRGVFLHLFLG